MMYHKAHKAWRLRRAHFSQGSTCEREGRFSTLHKGSPGSTGKKGRRKEDSVKELHPRALLGEKLYEIENSELHRSEELASFHVARTCQRLLVLSLYPILRVIGRSMYN